MPAAWPLTGASMRTPATSTASAPPWVPATAPRSRLVLPTKSETKASVGTSYMSTGVSIWTTRPSFMTTMRSLMDKASDWSCVTRTVVTPMVCCRMRSSSCMFSRSLASRLDRGSSSSRTGGSMTRARARATRWRWPPERSLGWRWLKASSLTCARALMTRSSRSALGTWRISRPKLTFSKAVMWGKSA